MTLGDVRAIPPMQRKARNERKTFSRVRECSLTRARISITAFFPAYNDEHTIAGMVRTVAAEIQKVTDDFEVVVVNDGSKDGTGPLLDSLCADCAIRESFIMIETADTALL